MKTSFTIMLATFIAFACISNQTNAEASWWDEGLSTLDKLTTHTEQTENSTVDSLNYGEIGEAFKQALQIGTENVVGQLGTIDGFNTDPTIHIPIPEELTIVKSALAKMGMQSIVDNLELKLNRAAEEATPKAKDLFMQAITEMTFDDLKNIYEGPQDSATQYFQTKMSPLLKTEMEPIVKNALSQVGAVQAYDKVVAEYKTLPFVPDIKANLEEHVIEKGIAGIFHYIAVEEAEIRNNPAKQTTVLLKKVFGID